ncbi:MAG TPA: isoprenylcysteine carboxylmethyltransferase family protein [Candidatus Acidoferrales bacterium]|jgi:protein-S-isoprenylcysteine O-methyltransferase Ste14|nr:isoprenylcysteine carboxylmethyltransferase family protein [Candidatus Acidoferrales bacterium]
MASEIDRDESQSDGKATGGLRPTTAMLLANALAGPGEQPHFIHSLPLRFAETAIFLVAVIGAIALGLGITAYFGEHPYVVAFLVAYAGFRFSDLIVRDDAADSPPREELSRRIAAQLPLLLAFAAAPFERTYVYGGSASPFVAAFGLLLELCGMWLALGARIQLGFFTSGRTPEHPVLVKRGFYRYLRHPIYAGTFLVTFGWTLIYGAPVTAILTLIIGAIFAQRRMKSEEAMLRARFGEEYDAYARETDALIPAIW